VDHGVATSGVDDGRRYTVDGVVLSQPGRTTARGRSARCGFMAAIIDDVEAKRQNGVERQGWTKRVRGCEEEKGFLASSMMCARG
jgi:hypothetical protein